MKKACIAVFIVLSSLVGCAGDRADNGSAGDGDKMAFSSGYVIERDGDIFVIDKVDYQTAKQLTDSGSNSDPSISADGRTVVYIHDKKGQTSLRKISSGGTGDAEVWAPDGDIRLSQPALSFNGSQIAFVARNANGSRIVLINSDGSNRREIPSSNHDLSPAFSPDGNWLVALSVGASAAAKIVRIEFNGYHYQISPPLEGLGGRLVVSPDSTRIAFERLSEDEKRHVYITSLLGAGEPISLFDAGKHTGGNEGSPTWIGPNRIGFVSDYGGISNVYESELGSNAYQFMLANAASCSFGGGR